MSPLHIIYYTFYWRFCQRAFNSNWQRSAFGKPQQTRNEANL